VKFFAAATRPPAVKTASFAAVDVFGHALATENELRGATKLFRIRSPMTIALNSIAIPFLF